MSDDGLNRLGIKDAIRGIEANQFTAADYLKDCVARIAEREPAIKAWPHLALDDAAKHARIATKGRLRGLPIGVKDIIDTHDMPTRHGSPIYANSVPPADAACVAMLRAAGAIILGKTATPEFAAVTPGPTTNPHNTAHSPGGSSSGSAAAVADFMVPAALGTQTVGSTIRPASYCGVVGFVPSFQVLPVAGVKTQASSLDHLGVLTRSVEDAAIVAEAIVGNEGAFSAPDLTRPPRIGFCPSPHWPQAYDSTRRVMDEAMALLRRAGAIVEDADMPASFSDVLNAHLTILVYEFSRALAFEYFSHRSLLSEKLTGLLDRGFAVPYGDYLSACEIVVARRIEADRHVARYDVLLTPSASGEALLGINTPSDMLFQRFWTALHLPVVSIPGFTGVTGLPVGLQIVGKRGKDAYLLSVCRWIEQKIVNR
ncbi:MAG TPA: amidase [Xanthobacteraceae bacterium]|jgi:Asp-tRNA(Asn)/Glu-tRNA(Gln) amidotransferase A subunit family amidase|nr:amidase [Xanthobacteraceae bacterium]